METKRVNNLYRWKDSYDQGSLGTNTFVKGILKFLENGQKYTYYIGANQKFCGHINAFDGPLGLVQIISSAQWANEDTRGPIEVRAIYLGKIAAYAVFYDKDDSKFSLVEHKPGHWSNSVCNYYMTGNPWKQNK